MKLINILFTAAAMLKLWERSREIKKDFDSELSREIDCLHYLLEKKDRDE